MSPRRTLLFILPLGIAAGACRPKEDPDQSQSIDPGDSLLDDTALVEDTAEDTQGEETDTGPAEPVGSTFGTATDLLGGAELISFVVPFPRGEVADVSALRVDIDGGNVPFNASAGMSWWSAEASSEGLRTALVQVDASWMTGTTAQIDVRWGTELEGEPPGSDVVDPADEAISAAVDETVNLAERTIEEVDGLAALVETATSTVVQYSARQPRVLVALDTSAWTDSQALGAVPRVADWEGLGFGALAPLGQGLSDYARSAAYLQDYGLNINGVTDPVDALQFEFGRCTTLIDAAVLTEDPDLLAEAHRMCSWYTAETSLWAASLGLWTLNDPVSGLLFHGRDLFSYATLSGDGGASVINARVATVWMEAPTLMSYRELSVEGEQWMEQVIGTAMEGIWYGYLSSGDPDLLAAMEELVGAVYLHTTGSDEDLAAMGLAFPSQGCLVHSEVVAGEGGDAERPWCSPWQTATLLDPMIQYRELTGDSRVDEIFIAWGRYLRDTATSYAVEELTYCDSFLDPQTCYETPAEDEDPRMLLPLYGAAINAAGERVVSPDDGEFSHCPDVAALAAASLASLSRHPEQDAGPVGPFASEMDSFGALYQELASCGLWTLSHYHRPKRNPSYWTAEGLEAGLADPATFIASNKIGYPDYALQPLRSVSWWFNTGLLQVSELSAAGLPVDALEVGGINPEECADPTLSVCP